MVLRYFLTAAFLVLSSGLVRGQPVGPRDVDSLPASKPDLIQKYGADALQFGELRLPSGKGPFPVAVIIHGGCWTKGFATVRNTAPIATELTKNNTRTTLPPGT